MSKKNGSTTLPKTYSPPNGAPKEHLAYLNWQEMQALLKMNGQGPKRGPKGIPSFYVEGNWSSASSPSHESPNAAAAAAEKMAAERAAEQARQAAAKAAAEKAAAAKAAAERAAFNGIARSQPTSVPGKTDREDAFGDINSALDKMMADHQATLDAQRAMQPTYEKLTATVAMKDPMVQSLLGTGNLAANFAAQRGLLTGMREIPPEERTVSVNGRTGTLNGSYNTNSGIMSFNPEVNDVYQDPRSPFNNPAKNIAGLMSHEVFGHGVNEALGNTLQGAGEGIAALDPGPMDQLNTEISSLSVPSDPLYKSVYGGMLGDEVTARMNELRSVSAITNANPSVGSGMINSAFDSLRSLVPNTVNDAVNWEKLNAVMDQRDAELSYLTNNNIPTAQEYALGLIGGRPASEVGIVSGVDPRAVYEGFFPDTFYYRGRQR